MNQYKGKNKGFAGMLVLIENTTRKAYAYPFKKKSETNKLFDKFLIEIKNDIIYYIITKVFFEFIHL